MVDKGKRPMEPEGSDELAKAILEDLEDTEDGFFNNFLRRNGVDVQDPGQAAVMSNRAAGGLKITNSDRIVSGQLSPQRPMKKKKSKMSMLREKLDDLKASSSALAAQLELAQKTADALKAERVEMRAQMKSIEQKVQYQESLNKEMTDVIERLRFLIGRLPPPPTGSDESAATAPDTNTEPPKKSD